MKLTTADRKLLEALHITPPGAELIYRYTEPPDNPAWTAPCAICPQWRQRALRAERAFAQLWWSMTGISIAAIVAVIAYAYWPGGGR